LNRLGLFFGTVVLVVVLVAAPIPLVVTLQNPARNVTIYPNLLIAIPLILLAALLLLYGATAENHENAVKASG
jgi:predicted neutral ceramidase superfamily lipid hydrolase